MTDTSFTPLILRNMTEICACMGVGKEKIFRWIDQGAPIAVEREGGRTSYTAEAASLQNWRVQRSRAKLAGDRGGTQK